MRVGLRILLSVMFLLVFIMFLFFSSSIISLICSTIILLFRIKRFSDIENFLFYGVTGTALLVSYILYMKVKGDADEKIEKDETDQNRD